MFRKEGRIGKKKTRSKRRYVHQQDSKIDIKPIGNNITTNDQMNFQKETSPNSFERRVNLDFRTEGIHNSENFQNYGKLSQNIPNYELVIHRSMQLTENFLFQQQQLHLQENLANWLHKQEIEKLKMSSVIFQNFWNQAITEKLIQAILS